MYVEETVAETFEVHVAENEVAVKGHFGKTFQVHFVENEVAVKGHFGETFEVIAANYWAPV